MKEDEELSKPSQVYIVVHNYGQSTMGAKGSWFARTWIGKKLRGNLMWQPHGEGGRGLREEARKMLRADGERPEISAWEVWALCWRWRETMAAFYWGGLDAVLRKMWASTGLLPLPEPSSLSHGTQSVGSMRQWKSQRKEPRAKGHQIPTLAF